MNFKITILLLAFLPGPLPVSAKTFYPGYLLLKNGEKKEGLVSYSPSRKNASTVFFKPNKEAAEEEYNASGTSEFYIEAYTTFFISVFEKATKKIVFTEVEIRGALTLSTNYSLHVLSKKGDTLQLYLPVGKGGSVEDIELSGKLEARTNGLIKVFLADCLSDELNKMLSNPKLSTTSLARVAELYNKCKGQDIKKKKGHLEVGLLAGLNMTMLKFDNPLIDNFSSRPSYKVGITMDLMPSDYSSKLVLGIQLVLAQNVYELKNNAYSSFFKESKLDNLTIRIPVFLKIFLKPGQIGFFINPGFSPYVVVNPPTNKPVYYLYPSGQFLVNPIPQYQLPYGTFNVNETYKINTVAATAFIGIGWEGKVFSEKKIVTSVRYELGIGPAYSETLLYGSSFSNIQADVALKF